MKKLGVLPLAILAITLMFGGNAFAQNVGDNSVYFVTYYSNANTAGAPDQTFRIINDGDYVITDDVAPVEPGTLWAAFYVFTDSQDYQACCACPVTSDGILSESVNQQLTAYEFSARSELSRGVIKVISSSSSDPTDPVPTTGLRGWATHIQATTTTFSGGAGFKAKAVENGPWFVTEVPLADSNLSSTELSNLGTLCGYGLTLGSGWGYCPCTPEDYDF